MQIEKIIIEKMQKEKRNATFVIVRTSKDKTE